MILFPCCIGETYPSSNSKSNGEKKEQKLLFLIEEPEFIHSKAVESISPIRMEYIQFWLEEHKPKIIIP